MKQLIIIPKDWNSVKLNDALEFVIGGDWGKDETYEDSNYNFAYCIRGSEIKNWEEDKGKTATLRKIKINNIEKRKLIEGDILVEISGGGPDQPVGRTVLIDKTVLSYNSETPKICTNFLRLMRPKKEFDSKFLNLFLKLFYYSGEIVKYQGGSNNLRNLKFPDFVKIIIPLPTMKTQQLIVSKIEELFSELDKGIENLKTAQQQLSVYKKAILMDGVTGKLTEKWRIENPKSESSEALFQKIQKHLDLTHKTSSDLAISKGKRKPKDQRKNKRTTNVESELPKLPTNWGYYRLEDITYLVTDGTHFTPKYKESGVKFLSVKNVRPFYFREEHVKYISPEEHSSLIERCHPQKNDILYTKVGATYGYAAKVNLDYDFSIFVSLCLIKPVYDFFSSDFLEILMNSELVFQQARKRISGTAVPDLHLIEIRDFKIPLPSFEEQLRIVQEIENRLSVADKMEESINQSLQQSEALRQSILKKAFEGKLI